MNGSYRDAIQSFAEVAAAYCRLIERRHEQGLDAFIAELDALLPRLYSGGRAMAEHQPENLLLLDEKEVLDQISFDELIEPNQAARSAVDALAAELKELLGDNDQHYVGVNYTHPSRPDSPVNGELPDTDVWFESTGWELAEMYESIRTELRFFRQGDIEDAGRGWLFGFYGTWGQYIPHLLGETFRLAHETISQEPTEL